MPKFQWLKWGTAPLLILLFFVFGQKVPAEDFAIGLKEVANPSVKFRFLRKINIGNGYYPGIVFAHNKFYVSYGPGERKSVVVKQFNKKFKLTKKYNLAGGPHPDYQLVFNNNYFYICDPEYLRKYDSNWNESKSVSILDNLPQWLSEKWPHGVDDMLLYYKNKKIYLGVADGTVKEKGGKKIDSPDNLYIQEYNRNLEVQKSTLLKKIGNVPGSSMIFKGKERWIISSNKHWDDSSLVALKYDKNWKRQSRKIISTAPNTNEEFPMGVAYKNGVYYIAYHHLTGELSVPTKEKTTVRTDVVLKALDLNWNLLDEKMVTSDIPAEDLMSTAGRPHLAIADGKIYVAYDVNGKIIVKEYGIK